MNEIALVTATFGGVDDLKALPEHPGIDAFYFTDETVRAGASAEAIASWTSVAVPNHPRHDFGPALRAKYFKLQIHRLDETARHRWLVWADGSLQFHETRFMLDEVEKLKRLRPEQRALFIPHPERRTLLEEYEYCRDEMARGNEYLASRYAKERIDEEIAWYRQRGGELAARLWCGTFWIVENSPLYRHAWDDWWHYNIRFGMQDQLSLPMALAGHHIEPSALDVLLWKNSHFSFRAERFLRGIKL